MKKKAAILATVTAVTAAAAWAVHWFYTDGDRNPKAQENLRTFNQRKGRERADRNSADPESRMPWEAAPWP